MKIAIKGHESRGKEVIQILESLGGKNSIPLEGTNQHSYYGIWENHIIALSNLTKCKLYTLEEFEKEFPFKVGDKVIDHEGDVAIITGFAYIEEKLGYSLQYKNGRGTATSGILKPYKEMKEERNITLTLDKAKEWYKKGGELKEIALQAFSEEELTKVELPKSWEEFCKNYPIRGEVFYIDIASDIQVLPSCATDFRDVVADRNICPSKKSAEAHLAMMQLEQLRNCWWDDWKPIWGISQKWSIRLFNGIPSLGITTNISKFLTFPTREMAEEFLKCFRDLIEKAGDLI